MALLAGAKAARGSSLNAWALSETLCPALPPKGDPAPIADQWGALLAGRVLVECADLAKVAKRDQDKLARVREWQRTIMRLNTLPAVERALAGRSLAALGDPRPEVMTLDGMRFCLVPPGPFVMGDDTGSFHAGPRHKVELPYAYFLALFPVTVAQWRGYVQLSGDTVRDERYLRGRDNDPVVMVSWHDAMRFCEFLTEAWRNVLPKGFIVTLPSEAEWEKAARGGERTPADFDPVSIHRGREKLAAAADYAHMPNRYPARAYPWGEEFDADKASAESNIGETSAVGCYPMGFSPYGCEEMSGTVWEWTRSLGGTEWVNPDFPYPYDPDDPKRENLTAGDEVLRGGSWRSVPDFARCAYRVRSAPDSRLVGFGFRVVLCSAPVGFL